jgi:arylsulfatase A-like enzyme
LPDDIETLPEGLHKAGYATAAFVNNTFLAPEFGLQQGFDRYDYRGARNDEHRSSDETVREALDWIDNQLEPIFLLMHFMEPHPYFDPPEEIRGTFSGEANPNAEQAFQEMDYVYWVVGRRTPTPGQLNRVLALYDEEILTADRALGLLVEGLEARRRWDQTLVVVTADHGEEFWDHGAFEHGHDLHGELTRVPLVIVGEDVGTGEVRDLVDHRGLFRWMKARAGGEDRGPLEPNDAQPGGEGDSLRFSVSENTLRGQPMASVINEQYRLVFMMETGVSELWSVDERGAELEPAGDEAERRMKQRLLEILTEVRGDLKPVPVIGPEFPSPEVFDQLRELGYIQ